MPAERTRAVLRVREFLVRLSSPYAGGIKGVRREVREEARRLLRHMANRSDLWQAAQRAPEVFGPPPPEEWP